VPAATQNTEITPTANGTATRAIGALRTSTTLPALVGLVLALVIVVGHLWLLGDDFSVFVRAAPPFAEPGKAPPSLRILEPAQTYDGQFFYRLAVDPWVTREVGVSLDHPSYRQQRILYPLIVRVLSLGQDAWVPVVLVAVNVAGLAVLGSLGARLAMALGAPVWWGVALPLWAGFTFSLARDLSEIVQSCFLVATLLALQQRRWRLAAAPMALAVLARETAVLLAVAILAASALEKAAGRTPTHHAWWAGAAGLLCYLGLQAAVCLRWGTPALATGATNLAVPLSAPLRYLGMVGPLGRIEFAFFALLVVLAVFTPRVPGYLRLALVGYVALVLSLSTSVWDGDVAWLRAATEAAMLAWVAIFHAGTRHAAIVLSSATVLWPAVARWAIAT
jgi:hypothetical protein